jgi:hypothetical protein
MSRPADSGGGNPPKVTSYKNPLRDITGLTPERVDMGVDYAGQGPIYALGPGVITAVNTAWAGGVGAVGPGTWIAERLTSGPLAGHQIYVAENVAARVNVGDHVTADTVIAFMTGQGAGIETGFAADGQPGEYGETLAASLNQQAQGHDPGAWSSASGAAYSAILGALGAPEGIMSAGGPHGQNPDWLDAASPVASAYISTETIIGAFAQGDVAMAAAAKHLAVDAQSMVSQGTAMQAIGRAGWRP